LRISNLGFKWRGGGAARPRRTRLKQVRGGAYEQEDRSNVLGCRNLSGYPNLGWKRADAALL